GHARRQGGRAAAAGRARSGAGGRLLQAPVGRVLDVVGVGVMEIRSDNPEHGFQFPGEFEITAMGPAGSGLEEQVPSLLEAAGLPVLRGTVSVREASGGRFVSVRLTFRAESREQYEV